MTDPLWPLYHLRLRTERLELRLPNEVEIGELCLIAKAGIHPPGEMPFGVAWSTKPSPRFEREYIRAQLKRHDGNLSAAARSAEVDRKHFRELLRKHGLRESAD